MTRNISRRTFLHGASTIAAAGALSGAVGAAAILNAQGLSDPIIPSGVKFRGVNLANNFTRQQLPTATTSGPPYGASGTGAVSLRRN